MNYEVFYILKDVITDPVTPVLWGGLSIKSGYQLYPTGLKEEAEIGNRSRHGSGTSSSGERLEPPELPPTMEQTLNIILLKLDEKRRDAKRPEDVDVRNTRLYKLYQSCENL
jgi:hypothetical protein